MKQLIDNTDYIRVDVVVFAAIVLALFCIFIVIRRSHDAEFEDWIKDFESKIGYKVDTEDRLYILSYLYLDGHSIDYSIKKYKEIKDGTKTEI